MIYDIGCRSGLNIVRDSEVTCGSVPHKAGESRWTISVRNPEPPKANPREEERERKNSGSHKGREQLIQSKSIDPALKTCQSHTVEHTVTKIVPYIELLSEV